MDGLQILLIILVGTSAAVYILFLGLAYKLDKASRVQAFMFITVVFGYFFDIVLFGGILSATELGGVGLVLLSSAGLLYLTLGQS